MKLKTFLIYNSCRMFESLERTILYTVLSFKKKKTRKEAHKKDRGPSAHFPNFSSEGRFKSINIPQNIIICMM